MLSLLLDSDEDAVVSVEAFEDVGVQKGEDTVASQTKSSTTKNPVGNRAEPFWKTLFNWLEALRIGQLSITNTLFELYVFGDFDGEVCTLFSKARSESEATAALKEAKALLIASGEPVPDFVNRVLEADPKTLASLIIRFRYEHGSGNSVEDLREQFRRLLVPAEVVERVVIHAIGWVKQNVDTLIESRKIAAIPVLAFRNEISSYVQSLIFSACLADLAGPVQPEAMEGHRSRRYVLQLELIAVTDDRILRAISAYLRSSVNRAEWGRLALVHEHGFDDFERRLREYWGNSRTQCEIALNGKSEAERGRYLLAECMKLSSPLQGRPVPYDFVEGCFHALADELIVGWHPDFEKHAASWK